MPSVFLDTVHNKLTKSKLALAFSAVALSHTGDTLETELARVALAPAAMGPNGYLQITDLWTYPNNANTKTMRLRFGAHSAAIATMGLVQELARTTSLLDQQITLLRNRNDQAKQVAASPTLLATIGNTTSAVMTLTIDTSAAVDLAFTVQCGNAGDTIKLEAYLVELFYGA